MTIVLGSTGSRNYTANWTLNTYTVTFDATGGEVTPEIGTTGEGWRFVSLPTPTRTGYAFDGWFTEQTDGESVTTSTVFSADAIIYAQWTPIVYTITFSLNGGTVTSANPTNYTIETTDFTLNNPTRAGHTFAGWTGANGTIPQTTVSIVLGSTGNREYTANWTLDTYTISYNLNGGTNHASNPATYTLQEGGDVSTNILSENFDYVDWMPANFGWILSGFARSTSAGTGGSAAGLRVNLWSNRTSAHAQTPIVALGNSQTFSFQYRVTNWVSVGGTGTIATPASNFGMNVQASTNNGATWTTVWTLSDHLTTIAFQTVQFNLTGYANQSVMFRIVCTLNSGDFNVDIDNVVISTSVSQAITLHPATRDNYTFGGWYDNEDFTGTAVTSIPTGSTGNREFWARWTPITYTITYDLDGGTVEIANLANYTIETADFTLNNPTRAGYTFAGWTGTDIVDPQMVVTIEHGSAGNRTYTANWTLNTYMVTFDVTGGEVTPTSGTTNTNWRLAFLPTPTRTGYTFNGWFTAEAGGTQVTTNTAFDADVTIYAQWTVADYTITYTLNGGTVNPANPTSYTIETAGFTLNNPTRIGYTFMGWTGTNGITPQTIVSIAQGNTGNRTYTANWMLNTYTVTFDANGGEVTPTSGTTNTDRRLASLPTPTRIDYTFEGWFTDATGGVLVTTNTPFDADATIYALWTPIVAVLSPERIIPPTRDDMTVVAPITILAGEFTAGPNPVSKSSGAVTFYWQGKALSGGTLSVFDVNGNLVARVSISDNGTDTKLREIGRWNFGNVAEGTYVVRGVLTGKDGSRERVSVVVGVR